MTDIHQSKRAAIAEQERIRQYAAKLELLLVAHLQAKQAELEQRADFDPSMRAAVIVSDDALQVAKHAIGLGSTRLRWEVTIDGPTLKRVIAVSLDVLTFGVPAPASESDQAAQAEPESVCLECGQVRTHAMHDRSRPELSPHPFVSKPSQAEPEQGQG